jgi:hypothetical protein
MATTAGENCMANSNQQHSKCSKIISSQKWNTQIQTNSYDAFHKVLWDQTKTASSFPSLYLMVRADTTIHK